MVGSTSNQLAHLFILHFVSKIRQSGIPRGDAKSLENPQQDQFRGSVDHPSIHPSIHFPAFKELKMTYKKPSLFYSFNINLVEKIKLKESIWPYVTRVSFMINEFWNCRGFILAQFNSLTMIPYRSTLVSMKLKELLKEQ